MLTDNSSKWEKFRKSREYLPPEYYDKLLKEYTVKGISDLEILEEFLVKRSLLGRTLELGCGSGRATNVISKVSICSELHITDLSHTMLKYTTQRINSPKFEVFSHQFDHYNYLINSSDVFDTIISLWSIGHSFDPWFLKFREKAEAKITMVLEAFLTNNLASKGRVLFIHTDWQSEEQKIRKMCRLFNDREKKLFYYNSPDSPSVTVSKIAFGNLVKKGIFAQEETKMMRVIGDEIEYNSLEEAIEIFMNFHMEGEYNSKDRFESTKKLLINEFIKIINKKGKLSIGTGWWIFESQRK